MNLVKNFKNTLKFEAEKLTQASTHEYPEIEAILTLLAQTKGKVVIAGLGKSGHIGKKMAASFASTGTPSVFMHATEGLHGDLGLIQKDDVVILISNSGETAEVNHLFPSIKTIGAKTIAITSKVNSTLATSADYKIVYNYDKESDPLNLAPTTSALVVLAIGDALAVSLSMHKNFKKEDFHVFHPGGSLGKSLEKK